MTEGMEKNNMNSKIKSNKILRKYYSEINKVNDYLKNNLSELDICSVVIYGSSTYSGMFIEGVSDIDILAYSKKMKSFLPEEIIDMIKEQNMDFKDKEPVVYIDHIGYRIEFYIRFERISIDITILPYEIPNFEKRETDASYDSLEMLMGALYEHGIVLYGNRPFENYISKNFFPFYDDELRRKRLDIITTRLILYIERLDIYTNNHDANLIDHLYKTRNLFLKRLFIFKKKYPVNLSKHIDYQLQCLYLSDQEIKTLEFLNGDIFCISKEFLKLVNKYLQLYKLERE